MGDDFDGEDGGEDADDAEAEDVEFEDFAASLTPEETCERISKLAAAHIANVLGFELPPDLGERAFDPAAIARSPQPLPAALEFTLAAGADSAVLASCPTDRADARGHLSAPRDRAAFGEDPEAPSTSLAAFRVPSAPERSARIRLHDPRRPSAYPRLWSLLRTVHAHCSEGRTVTNRGLYYLLATADHALWGPNAAKFSTAREAYAGPVAFDARGTADDIAYSAFSQGTHKCPGERVALVIVQTTLALLVARSVRPVKVPPLCFERATLAQRAAPVRAIVGVV